MLNPKLTDCTPEQQAALEATATAWTAFCDAREKLQALAPEVTEANRQDKATNSQLHYCHHYNYLD